MSRNRRFAPGSERAGLCVLTCTNPCVGRDLPAVLALHPGPIADMAAYNALVQRLFTQNANVRNVKTFFATKRAKFDPRIDAAALRRPT